MTKTPIQNSAFDSLIPLWSTEDERGTLIAVENGEGLPFSIQRVVMIMGAGNAPRGFHAHRKQHQLLIGAAGGCEVIIDDGWKRQRYTLERPDRGLYLAPMEWVEIESFTDNCVLLLLASMTFNEADYIRDYQNFLAERRTL